MAKHSLFANRQNARGNQQKMYVTGQSRTLFAELPPKWQETVLLQSARESCEFVTVSCVASTIASGATSPACGAAAENRFEDHGSAVSGRSPGRNHQRSSQRKTEAHGTGFRVDSLFTLLT